MARKPMNPAPGNIPQQPYANQRNANTDDSVLQTANYGGLNTISSRLNIPLEDSPSLLNVRVNEKGNITKRQGTDVLKTVSGLASASGTTLVPITFKNGFPGMLAKEGTSLKLYILENDELVEVLSKIRVWSNKASSVRADYAVTSEVEPRVIFTTGVNVPVQATLIEHSGTSSTNLTYSFVDDRFASVTNTNFVIWRNGVRLTGVTVNYTTLTETVTFSHSSFAVNDIISIVFCTWQWWAEALKLEGDQTYFHTTKFHVNKTDQNVPINSRITTNILPILHGEYPIIVYKSTAFNDKYTFMQATRKPTQHNEYAFSTGGRYDAALNDEILPGISYITFGDIKPYTGSPSAPSSPEPVHFIRAIKLPFRGDRGQAGNKLIVNIDETTSYTQNTTLSSAGTFYNGRYYLRDNLLAVITNNTTIATFISFDAMATIGMAQTAFIEIISSEVNSNFVGTSALPEYTKYKDGALIPAYGLGNVADYYSGSFPRSITMYQGRLVFGGFPTAPMTVLMSNVYDSTRPGRFYTNYQTVFERSLATDPIDVLLTNTLDDYITGMIEFQNQLFVFSKQALHRVHGGSSGLVSPTSIFLNTVASIGAMNAQSICRVDKTVYFLSASGVYDITPTTEAGDFTAGEQSLKIRNMLQGSIAPYNESTAFMMYDRTKNEVYLGVSGIDTTYTCQTLFVFSTIREAWVKYDMLGGNWFTVHGCVLTLTSNQSVAILATLDMLTNPGTNPTTMTYLRTWNNKYIDQYLKHTGVGTSAFSLVTNTIYRKAVHTTNLYQTIYSTKFSSNQQQGFTMSDVVSIADAVVTLDSVELAHGIDWVKTQNSEIILLIAADTGRSLVITYKTPDNQLPVICFKDNVKLAQGVDYTVTEEGGFYKLNFTSCVNNAVYGYGAFYNAFHKTPFFIRSALNNIKEISHYTGYFDNSLGQEQYKLTDANSTSSQPSEQLIGVYKTRLNFSLVILYDEQDTGYSSTDIYGSNDVYWDDSVFDVSPPSKQAKRYARFVEPIIGLSYGFQVQIWVFDESTFELVGYELDAKTLGHSSLGQYD